MQSDISCLNDVNSMSINVVVHIVEKSKSISMVNLKQVKHKIKFDLICFTPCNITLPRLVH